MKTLSVVSVAMMCLACDGTGTDVDEGGDNSRVFVRILDPIDGDGSYGTIQPSVEVSGNAGILGKNVDCVSVLPTALTLAWRNISTGQSATAAARSYCRNTLLGLQWGTEWSIPYGSIDLRLGTNEILITASDGAGNSGQGTIVVTRSEDVTAPSIVGRTPAPGAGEVPVSQSLAVVFSESMLASSLTTDRFMLEGPSGQGVSGFVRYDPNTYRWELDPDADLSYATTYTATIDGRVEDEFGGNALGADVSWTFETAPSPDQTPPQVTDVSPAPGATCVVPDTRVLARFDEPLDPSTVRRSTFTLAEAGGADVTATVGYDGSVGVLEPSMPLLVGTEYEATLAADITDLAGNELGADFSWAFTTAAAEKAGVWMATTTGGAPSERRDHTAIWTGSEMIVFGGYGWVQSIGTFAETNTGARYDPLADRWIAINPQGVPPFSGHTAVLAGDEMIVWGGDTNAGARYRLGTDSWQPTNALGAPTARRGHAAVWTGTEMLVWGGESTGGTALASGGRYDPSTDTWAPMSLVDAPSPRRDMAHVWTGTEFIVWGGTGASGGEGLRDGARYDPVTDTWSPLPTSDADGGPTVAAVWTGSEMIVWGGGWPSILDGDGFPVQESTLRRYDPSTNGWRATASVCEPFLGAGEFQSQWTGSRFFVWAGEERGGYLYDPATDGWAAIETTGGPAAALDGAASVWGGERFILWGGQEPGGLRDTGFVFREP